MKEENNKFLDTFVSLGMKPQEAGIYLACVKLGQATATRISEISGIERTFVYSILDDLAKTGIVSSVEVSGVKKFSVISVEKLKSLHKAKIKKYEELLPELKAIEKTVGDRPKVQFFEGIEGFIQAQNDTLNLPPGSEILAYYTGEYLYEKNPQIPARYVRERTKRDIKVRAISPKTPATMRWTKQDKVQLRTSRTVPSHLFPFANEINIYSNKISILSLVGEVIAVIIESESIAKTQRAIFELAWLGAEKFVKE